MAQRASARASAPWYRGLLQHTLFWAACSSFFLFDNRPETGIRETLSFALGVTCLAAAAAVHVTRSRGKSRRGARLAYLVGATFVLGLLSLHGAYVQTVGDLTAGTIRAILQTDVREAAGYVGTNLLVAWPVMWAAAAFGLWLTLPSKAGIWAERRWTRPSLLAAAALLLFAGRALVTDPIAVVESYRDTVVALREATLRGQAHPLPPVPSDFEGTVIVVIGESTSRHHMSIYDYPRETTPDLEKLAPQMVVFGDVISSQSDTVDSLEDAFTVPRSSNVSILQLAHAAGFRTTWLSNQNQFGVWDSPVRIMAQQADQVRYHDPSLGNLGSRRVFDAAMLPSLDQVLAQPGKRKLIFMHLMSTHLPYCWTKPPDFNPLHEEFGSRLYGQRGGLRSRLKLFLTRQGGDLDCYDNGVRYVDSVLAGVIGRASRLSGPASVLYFSDHGEAPLLGTGHDGADHSAYQIEVPLLLWANAAYRSAYPNSWAAAEANRAKPFSLALLTPTLASLLQLHTPMVSPSDSLFNPHFRVRPRYALDGRIHYDARWPGNDYRENSRNFVLQLGPARNFVWAHRTDTLGALLEAKRTFSGVEMDVVFDEHLGRFRVHHPPVPDIGLDLRDMLAWSRDRPQLKMWLDWKNATPANVGPALAELTRLEPAYHLKHRILIETGSDAVSPALAAISASGFVHAYYMPIDDIQAAMAKGGPATDALARRIERVVLDGRFDGVTYDAAVQPFVQSKLDAFLTAHGIRRFSWDTSIMSGRAETDPAAVARMLRERHLSGLLVKFPSYFLI